MPDPLDDLKPSATESPTDAGGTLVEHLRPVFQAWIVLTLLTGVFFPLTLSVLAGWIFPYQAGGSLISQQGTVVGSKLIGQAFSRPEYFHPRPSAAGDGYDARSSGGTNLGPNNRKLGEDAAELAAEYRRLNGLNEEAVLPIDAVTRSGSGLDPHISSMNAELQIPRIARARNIGEEEVRRLVRRHTLGRQLGFLCEPRVAVLPLNLELDHSGPP